MVEPACLVYEQDAVRRVAGDAIRPGGIPLTRRALALAELSPGARVLDLGCGVGATVEFCRDELGLDAVGLDLSAVLLADGRAQGALRPLLQASGPRLPFVGDVFQAVLAECSLSLMHDWGRALSEIRRVLCHGGLFIASDVYIRPDAQPEPSTMPLSRRGQPGDCVDPGCCLDGARSRAAFEAALSYHGFTLLHWEDHTPALKRFAARLIWEHGSLRAFWAGAGVTEAEAASGSTQSPFPSRPGYFLALAKRQD
jgi:SAM-dependent methyltransferase